MSQKTDQATLMWWYQALLSSVRAKERDMTMRQVSVLMTIYMTDAPHTVRGLAKKLGVTKPVITRALDTLEAIGYVKRKKDETDKRSILIQRTVKGAVYLSELSDRILDARSQDDDAAEDTRNDTLAPADSAPQHDTPLTNGQAAPH